MNSLYLDISSQSLHFQSINYRMNMSLKSSHVNIINKWSENEEISLILSIEILNILRELYDDI